MDNQWGGNLPLLPPTKMLGGRVTPVPPIITAPALKQRTCNRPILAGSAAQELINLLMLALISFDACNPNCISLKQILFVHVSVINSVFLHVV